MEIKHNDSTPNRPWGGRPVDAPFIPIDLHAYTQELMLEEAWQKNDRNAITVLKTPNITVVLVALHEDAEVLPGNFEGTGTFTLQVLDGKVHFVTGDEKLDINRGQMVALHGHIPFKATALAESMCLITMVKEK